MPKKDSVRRAHEERRDDDDDPGQDRDHRIAQHVAEHHLQVGQPLRPCRAHVVLADLLEEDRAVPACRRSDAGDDADQHRQQQEAPRVQIAAE